MRLSTIDPFKIRSMKLPSKLSVYKIWIAPKIWHKEHPEHILWVNNWKVIWSFYRETHGVHIKYYRKCDLSCHFGNKYMDWPTLFCRCRVAAISRTYGWGMLNFHGFSKVQIPPVHIVHYAKRNGMCSPWADRFWPAMLKGTNTKVLQM